MATDPKQSIYKQLPPWLAQIHENTIIPRRKVIANHTFMKAMLEGSAEPRDAQRYFSGLMWHLMGFDKLVTHLFSKRPLQVAELLNNRSEDKNGDTGILARIVSVFGGPAEEIKSAQWSYQPHPVWITHDALLRAVVYSPDLSWEIGAAGLNIGIESLVPYMIEPLFHAAVKNYGVSTTQAAWLESRAGEEEIQHGENGYILLSHFVAANDLALQEKCRFYIEALSYSMAYRLLQSGLPDPRNQG